MMRAVVWTSLCLSVLGCGSGATRTESLPPFSLINQSGEAVSAQDLRGYATVMSFIFTNCRDVCPLVTAQLASVQTRAKTEGLDAKVRFVSITVDPATDTPDVLKRHATGYGADLTTWHFLTGAPAEIGRLTHALGVATGSGNAVGHSNVVLFVDGGGRIAERYTGVELDPERILPKLRRLVH